MMHRIKRWLGDIVIGRLPRGIAKTQDKMHAQLNTTSDHISVIRERIDVLAAQLNSNADNVRALKEQINAVGKQVDTVRQIEIVGVDNIQALAAQAAHISAGLNNQKAESIARLSLVEYNISKLVSKGAKPATTKARAAADPTLYLDLLQNSLTGELTADGAISPWSKGQYDPQARLVGHDWPASALTMIGTARMSNVRHLVERVIEAGVPGDFIETGVWRGGACIYAKGIFKAYGENARNVWVADSFCGLPPPNEELYPQDKGDQHHTVQELAISSDDVRASFKRYGLLDENVMFLEGWFKDTLPKAPISTIAVLRLDGDMYESTMDALVALYDKVSVGGFIIVDDYVLPACAKAIHDFLDKRGIKTRFEAVDGAAVFWQKAS